MVVKWTEIDWGDVFLRHGLVSRGKKHRDKNGRDTLNLYTAFDIETSSVWLSEDHSTHDVHSFMYSWAFQIEEYTILGREWPDFFMFLTNLYMASARVKNEKNLDTEPKIIIWVHNLAYEFQFLSGLYDFTDDDCFFREERKPIYCTLKGIFEFRCSYIQTNLSLSMLCKQMGVPQKLSGQKFDYNKIRYPWTPLTDYELEYIITDVESLVKAMKKRVEKGGDNLVTVPLTSTGYVRRDCRASLAKYKSVIHDMMPDERQYRLLREAFRGGNTHGNRKYTGKILSNVTSYDIVSCYPTQQLTQMFPMKKFKWLDTRLTMERVLNFIGLGYAVVGRYQFRNLRLKNKQIPMPYISLSKTDSLMVNVVNDNGKKRKKKLVKLDNGRILESYYSEMVLTEIDLKIILEQYTFDEINVTECMVAQKKMLPLEYRNVIQDYYNNKTKLKGDDTDEGKYLYIKFKGLLNAIFGMSATDPIHQKITYCDGVYTRRGYSDMEEDEIEKVLNDAPFPYQWGVYTTAYAREQLQRAINLAGNKIVYCDTDSIKVIGDIDVSYLNRVQLRKAEEAGAYADDMNGNRHYLGLFECDGRYEKFIEQGSKRYAYIKDGCKYKECPDYNLCHMGVTVSGVTKQKNEETGRTFAVEELGCLENFQPGMTWSKAGGTMAVYNDDDDFDYMDASSGGIVHVTKNVAIIPTTYTMTHAKDYSLLLSEIKLYGEYKWERE